MGDNQFEAQILKGLLDTLVLNVLKEKDNYGFGILQRIADQMNGETSVLREATMYPLLHRLEAKGLVDTYWKPGDRGTDRKYYRITHEGRAYLTQRISDWQTVAGILKKLVFPQTEEGRSR